MVVGVGWWGRRPPGLCASHPPPTCPFLGQFVQQHRELEVLNSFREQFGCDWLHYKNQLETSGTKTPALSTLPPGTLSPETVPGPLTGPLPPENKSPQEVAQGVRVGLELQEEEGMEGQGEEEAGKEREQEEMEGERPAARWQCVPGSWGNWTRGGGSLWVEAHLVRGQGLGSSPYRVPRSLLSGALSPHVGVSPGGAPRCAGQAVLSPGHFRPPVSGGTPSSSNPRAAGAAESGGS